MSDLLTMDFHGAPLILVNQDGQPFVAMKNVVEGMGLSWSGQYERLNRNAERWGMVNMTIPSGPHSCDTNGPLLVCIPLRKLPGFMSTIQASRVKVEIRDRVVLFQNECDDALWDYWTKGQAVNPREEDFSLPDNVQVKLSAAQDREWIRIHGIEGARTIHERVCRIFRNLPGVQPRNPQEAFQPALQSVEPTRKRVITEITTSVIEDPE